METAHQKLYDRLGLQNEAHLKTVTAGSARKERMVEKIMMAELHCMEGELKVERYALRNENKALKEAVQRLRLAAARNAPAAKASPPATDTRLGCRDVIMEEAG